MSISPAPIMEKASAGMRELLNTFSVSEAKFFDEERFSEAELRRSLSDNVIDKKVEAMKRILAAVSVGRDASMLFPDVVKNVSSQSLELKKLIYIYLVQYSENNRDLALLSINSFQKDLENRSQLVRASALRAMASIKVLEVVQLVIVAVKNASHDSSPYVRKTAAQCVTKVYAVDRDRFLELRNVLLRLLSDEEVIVVSSAITAFHHMCIMRYPQSEAARSQLELLHPYFHRLCQEVLLMDAWAQLSCIDALLRYSRTFFAKPGQTGVTEDSPAPLPEDLEAFLRVLKLLFNSMSKAVILAAAAAFCYLAPAQDLSVTIRPLLRALRQAPSESAHVLMIAFMPIVDAMPDLLRPSIREFFCSII